MKTAEKVTRAFTAFLLVFLMIPTAFAWALTLTPEQVANDSRDSGDITSVVQISDSGSWVEINGTKVTNDIYDSVPDNASIKIHYEISLPNDNGLDTSDSNYQEYHYKAGDTFTLQLPGSAGPNAPLNYTGLPVTKELYIDPSHPSEDTHVGTLSIDAGGKATITFTNYVEQEDHSSITAWFEVGASFSDYAQQHGSPVTIAFQSRNITLTPTVKPAQLGLDKKGSYDAENNEITWTVTVDPTSSTDPVDGVSLVDYYGAGNNQTYVADSFTVSPSTGGTLVNDAAGSTLTYTFSGPIHEEQTITYKTKPTGSAFAAENASNNSSTFNNTATLKVNGAANNTKTASVSLDWIQKSKGTFTPGSPSTMSWTVTAGISGQTINNALVKDSLPAGLTLDAGSVKWNNSAVQQDTSNPPGTSKFYYDPTSRLLVYNAGTLTGQGTLSYSATVPEDVLETDNTGSTSYVNKAWLTWTEEGDSDANAPSASGTGTVGPGGLISKSGGGDLSYSHNATYLTWTLHVNSHQTVMPAGTEVVDTIPVGQSFYHDPADDANSVVITGDSANKPSWSASSDGTTLTLTFPNQFSTPYTITYKTKVEDTDQFKDNGTYTYSNSAKLTKDGGITYYDASASQKVYSQVLDKSVATDYDYDTHRVTWTIAVDRNKLPLNGASVVDTLPSGMTYVDGTFQVDGNPAEPVVNTVNNTVSYTFTSMISEEHTITLTTQLTNDALSVPFNSKTFTNTADLKAEGLASVEDTADVTVKNPIVTKSGSYASGNDYIDWSVDVNQALLPLQAGVTLTDSLNAALQLDTDSVKIYPVTVNSDGSLSVDTGHPLTADTDYTVKYDTGTNTVVFTFKNAFSTAYEIRFTTDVLSTSVSISNQITMKGIQAGDVTAGTSGSINVSYVEGGAGSGSAYVTVIKQDESGNTLPGAEFRLLNLAGRQLADGTTGADGKLQFSKLGYHTYFIQEVAPPAGYVISDPTPYRVRLTSTNSSQTSPYVYIAKDKTAAGDISFTKTNVGGTKALSGAEFQLYRVGDPSTVVQTAQSDSKGAVTFTGVPIGSYNIFESVPANGYVRTLGAVLTASVDYASGDTTKTVSSISGTSVENAEALGSFSFTKIKPNGDSLPGAGFTLYDASHAAVQTATSNSAGQVQFNAVPLGTYTVVETAVPSGYRQAPSFNVTVGYNGDKTGTQVVGVGATVTDYRTGGGGSGGGTTVPDGGSSSAVSSSSSASSVASSSAGGTSSASGSGASVGGVSSSGAPVSATAAIYLKKTDPNGRSVAGAEFTLYDASGNVLAKRTAGPGGVIVFQNLMSADYTVAETKAPKNYQLFDTPLSITLSDSQKVGYTLKDAPEGDTGGKVLGWSADSSLPKTGGFPLPPVVILLGLSLIALGAVLRSGDNFEKMMRHIRR